MTCAAEDHRDVSRMFPIDGDLYLSATVAAYAGRRHVATHDRGQMLARPGEMDQSKKGQDGPGLDCQIAVHGTFSLRSPVRPNLIGTSTVKLEAVEGSTLLVRSLDCLDGTTPFKPIAPPQRGDFEAGDSGPHNCQKA